VITTTKSFLGSPSIKSYTVNFRIRELLTKTIGYALAGYTKDLCTRPRDISKKD